MKIETHGWIDPGDGSANVVQVATVTLDPQSRQDGLPFGLRLSIQVGRVTAYAVLTADHGGRVQ